jgi:ribosomal protein S18 acetylase RimI-like enzyme
MQMVQMFGPQEGLSQPLGASIYALANAIWPPKSGNNAPTLGQTLERWQQQQSTHFLIVSGEEVFAHALIFPRTIFSVRGPLTIGALATVCVHPDYRGRGWGADVVRAVFAYLPYLGAEVALFQTGVPLFYEKLGARLVTNCFVNGDNLKNPFWDPYKMIYPATFDWPDEKIDLNGRGY